MNLYSQLKGLLMVAPKTDVRYYLCAVHVTPCGLRVSDGHMAVTIDAPQQGEALICRHYLAQKLKMFNAKSVLMLRIDGEKVWLVDDTVGGVGAIELKTVDGRFPDLNRALSNMKGKTPKEYSPIGFDLRLIAQLAKAVDTIAADKKAHVGRFDFFGPDGGLRIQRGDINGYLMPARL